MNETAVTTADSVSRGVNLSLYSLLKDIYSMTTGGVNERKKWGSCGPGLVTALDTVSRVGLLNKTRWPIVEYFLENGAATGYILKYKLNAVKIRTAYRTIDALRELEVIELGTVFKLPKAKKNTDTVVWVLKDLDSETRLDVVTRAKRLHLNIRSP